MKIVVTLSRSQVRDAALFLATHPNEEQIEITVATDETEQDCQACLDDCGNDCWLEEAAASQEEKEYQEAYQFLKDAGLL